MQIQAIKTPVIQMNEDLLPVLETALGEPLQDGDIVCVTSKVVSVSQGRLVRLADIEPSPAAYAMKKLRYSKDFTKHPELAELVIREADAIFVGEGGYVYLTLKHNILIANAGIDLSNAPDGYAILWPEDPWAWAAEFRSRLMARYHLERLGVLLTDSRLTPMRRGVTGVAMAYAGFEGVDSAVGKPDLYCRPLKVTERAIADDLAATTVLVTGEADERSPFALIREAPVVFTDRAIDPREMWIDPQLDLYAGMFADDFKQIADQLDPRPVPFKQL